MQILSGTVQMCSGVWDRYILVCGADSRVCVIEPLSESQKALASGGTMRSEGWRIGWGVGSRDTALRSGRPWGFGG